MTNKAIYSLFLGGKKFYILRVCVFFVFFSLFFMIITIIIVDVVK